MSAKTRLLVVDDDPAVLLTYQLILEHSGYEVTTATTAADARALLQQHCYDLLLADLALEAEDSGLELIHWARAECPGMGCVLLTGYPDAGISERVRQDGVHSLFKPIEVPHLLNTVDFLLRQK